MDDHVFGSEQCDQDNNMLWLEHDQVQVNNQSAFLLYYARPASSQIIGMNNNNNNINKRMIEFTRRSWSRVTAESQESGTRFHRRKMSERLRRENERKTYSALHSMLPLGTKNDKVSIMQMAARKIEELKGYKEVLERRNHNLQVKLLEETINDNSVIRSSKIEVRAENATSKIDYIVEVLKCLNKLGVKTTSIQSTLYDYQLLAVIHIQTQIPDSEVRKAVQRTLQEIEEKLQINFPEFN